MTKAQTTLTVWYVEDDSVDDTFLSLIDEYETQSGITVDVEWKDPESFPLDYKYAHSSGTPDVIQGDAAWIPNLVHSDSLLPIPADSLADDYIKEAKRMVSYYAREDGVYDLTTLAYYGFPLSVDTLAFIYNTDEQGVAIIPDTDGSWTTAEFKTAVTRMNDQSIPSDKQFGFTYINFLETGEALFLGAGGQMFSEYTIDQNHVTSNSTESREALTFIYKFGVCPGCFELIPSYSDDYTINNTFRTDLIYEDFAINGNISSTMLFARQLTNLTSSGIFADATKLGIAPCPVDENGQDPFLEVMALMINSQTSHEEEALNLAEFLSSKSSMVEMADNENIPPAILSAYDDTALTDNDIIQMYEPLVKQGSSKPLSRFWLRVEEIFEVQITKTMKGLQDGGTTGIALKSQTFSFS